MLTHTHRRARVVTRAPARHDHLSTCSSVIAISPTCLPPEPRVASAAEAATRGTAAQTPTVRPATCRTRPAGVRGPGGQQPVPSPGVRRPGRPSVEARCLADNGTHGEDVPRQPSATPLPSPRHRYQASPPARESESAAPERLPISAALLDASGRDSDNNVASWY